MPVVLRSVMRAIMERCRACGADAGLGARRFLVISTSCLKKLNEVGFQVKFMSQID